MDSIRVSEAPDTGSIPVEATKAALSIFFIEVRLLDSSGSMRYTFNDVKFIAFLFAFLQSAALNL